MEEIIKNLFLTEYKTSEIKMLNPLVLAFVGDTFFSFYIKTKRLDLFKNKVNALNTNSCKLVNAHSQRDFLFKIADTLTEDEKDIVMRARNTNIHSRAKNFSIEEYRHATAFEALIGYLYLTNNLTRLNEILNSCFREN